MSTTISPAEIVGEHLEYRRTAKELVVVEFGHRAEPICLNQPDYYIGGRAYIGVEADLRDPSGVVKASIQDKIKSERDRQNWFFITNCPDAVIDRYEDDPHLSYVLSGYDATTILPDKSADEIFLGNVFSDPMIAHDPRALRSLVDEVSRVATNGSKIISRETTTPWNLPLHNLNILDLNQIVKVIPGSVEFQLLEEIYRTAKSPSFASGSAYYLHALER